MLSLQEAVRLISSDKAKERSEGIEQYKDIFQNPQTLRDLTQGDDDGRRWLRTMQALFTCVQNDKSAVMKKGVADAAPITLRRLKESAHMVQWTIEKACSYYPQPAFISVFNHLTQSLDDRGYLFEPLATDYLKALRILLNYRPHMDHLESEKWTRVTACCFNILLNDTLDRDLEDCEISGLFVTQEMGNTSHRASRVLDAEVASCLQILVTAPNAPLIGPSRLGCFVLDRYANFLIDYPTDSTAHLPALQGLNHVLSELEVNESLISSRFATRVWSSLLTLWSTKSRQLKEQVIISLQIILPLFFRQSQFIEQVNLLQKKLLDEPNQRFALQPLALSSLEFCSSSEDDAFQYKTLRARRGIPITDSQTWATLEVAADCALSLYNSKANTLDTPEQGDHRPSKKLKQANGNVAQQPNVDAVQEVVERAGRGARGHDGKSLQLWSLQVLLFISLRHMQQERKNDDWIPKALPIITELLSHSDVEIQSWSLLILATLIPSPTLQSTCKQVWPTICRRVMQSGTSRTASHAAEAILVSGRVPQRETLHELRSLFEDLESQGLTYAYDSVCSFFTEAIILMSKDVTAAKSKPGEKVLAWLQSIAWSTPESSPRNKACGEMRDPADLVSLLCAICGFNSTLLWFRAKVLLPNTPIVTRCRQAVLVDEIKTFILTAIIPKQKFKATQIDSGNAGMILETVKRGPKSVEVRCLNFIQKSLKVYLQKMRDSTFTSTATLDQISKAVDFAMVSILFNGSMQGDRIASQAHIVGLAHELLHLSLQCVIQSRWTNTDTAFILTSLYPILCDKSTDIQRSKDLIQFPGKLAGIETEVLLKMSQDDTAGKGRHFLERMALLWKSAQADELFLAFQKLYDRSISTAPVKVGKTAQEQDDDTWAGIAPRGTRQNALCEIYQGPDEDIVTRVCISAMLAISHGSKADVDGQAQVKKYILLGEKSISFLLLSGSLFFEKTSMGELTFTIDELDQVLQTIGDELLTEYKYEKTVEAQLVALEFLDGTLFQWSAASFADDLFLKKALKLCSFFVKQLSKGLLLWRVEKRLTCFLEHFVVSAMKEGSPLQEINSSSLNIEAIIKTLLILNGRSEMRVRWPASTMTARLYEVWAQLGLDSLGIYEYSVPILPDDRHSKEKMATRILTFGNALVASSPARHVALYHLIELTLVDDGFNDYTMAVLELSSKLLGFTSVPSLWLLFVTQITWAILNNDLDMEELPFKVLGYKSQGEMLRQSFNLMTSMLVAVGSEKAIRSLKVLSSLTGKTQKEASIECIPSLVATDLAVLTEIEDVKEAFTKMTNDMAIRMHLKGNEGIQNVKKVLLSSLDMAVVGILRLFYEPDILSFASFIQLHDPNCTFTLERIEGLKERSIHVPCLPHFSGKIVYRSIIIMTSQMKETLSGPTVYSVVHQMVSLIYKERLINDQHRHIQALKLYLCLAQKTIEENTALIRLLIHSCAVLGGRVDLVDAVWPLLDWIFDLVKTAIPGLSSSLIGLLRHAKYFTRSNHSTIQQVGERLSERLGRLILRLKESKAGKNAAIETICAWPCEYPVLLTEREWDISIAKYTTALQATSSISASFLQRISKALQRANKGDITEFQSITIWIILECLERENLDDEERGQVAASIADLLHYCNGKITSPSSATNLFDLANRKGALTAINRIDIRSHQPLQPLKSWLTRQLVQVSRSAHLESAEDAVSCLREIFTLEPQFAGITKMDWDPLDAEDLRLITFSTVTIRKRKKRSRNELEAEEGVEKANQYDIWIVWICGLLCDLIAEKAEGTAFGPLSELVSNNADFAKDSFAVLLHIFLRSDLQLKEVSRVNSRCLSSHLIAILRRQQTDKEVWKAVIQAIVQLRHDDPTDEPLACDKWIHNIDYFLLQRRAVQCHLYATAILFAELENEHKGTSLLATEDAEVRLSLQYDVYSNVEDPDSFYGIKDPEVRHSLVNRLQHEGQWDRLFDLYAAQNEGTMTSIEGIATTLHHQGFNRLSLQVDEKQSTSYSAAWRMEKWDMPVDHLESGTSQSLYSALRAIHNESDVNIVHKALQRAYECEFIGLASVNVEANRAARSNARDLLGLREISHWQAAVDNSSFDRFSEQFEFDDVERIMSVRLSLLRSQRRLLEIGQMGDIPSEATMKVIEKESSTLLSLSQEARRTTKLQIAMNSVTQAQGLANDLVKSSVEEEFANLLWDLGDHATAIDSLTTVVKSCQTAIASKKGNHQSDIALPLALARLGHWRATARSHQPRAIQDECFAPAAALASKSTILSFEEKASVFYQFATFAHQQYQTLMKSTEGDNLTAFIRYRREEVEQLDVQMNKSPTSKIYRAKEKTEKLLQMDQDKLSEFERSKMSFRQEATRMYAVLLPITDVFDDKAVIRLVSLWFENADDDWINKDLDEWLKNVPSRKFLPFVHQLSSRLSQKSSATASLTQTQNKTNNYFQNNVKSLVFRMCFEHPFHALTPLYALTRADDDKEGRVQGSRKGNALLTKSAAPRASEGSIPIVQLLRKEAANDIINRVATKHSQSNRIKDWKRVCDACVQWARFDLAVQMPTIFGAASDEGIPKAKAHVISSKFNLNITRLHNVNVPVLTSHLPVDETCQYDDVVSIARYSDRFTTAGGVHLPKITECIGSDGKVYRQLFKNLDDLRQDAVMQQVFGVLNSLLSTDREAKKRELRVRTYMIIPLGPRYGLLEFVGNTRPLQAPLMATHNKYRRKGELSPKDARAQFAANEFKAKSRKDQAELFESIGRLLPPTFRFHFLERHKIPVTLLTNRLNYTRSVATTSIVGHILGLGDRHVSNILLDDMTGEVIHIDFGVAFDQGKLLPIPELVPFRLTRDMVDAMGLHGVEGVFRRCCQETLRVMREGASVIETVLQVFKYDPLYDWTQNPVKVIRAQAVNQISQEPSSSNNSSALDTSHRRVLQQQKSSEGGGKDVAELLAERAIGTVMEKLSTSLSVEYTVNDLMMQARDPANLGSIFSGWQAAL